MEPEACPVQTDKEQHWRKIIEAVRGSAAAQVWFDYKREGGFIQPSDEPDAPELVSRLRPSGMESGQS